MAKIEVSRRIAADPDLVFDRAADVANAAEFIGAVTKSEILTDGPVGVGTRFRESRVMFGREATEEMEFVEFERPSHYAVEAESCGARYYSVLRCTPVEGGTEVSMSFEGTPLSFFARIMSILMKPMMKKIGKQLLKDLDDLAAVCEADAAKASPGS
jgi:hypothetical protein